MRAACFALLLIAAFGSCAEAITLNLTGRYRNLCSISNTSQNEGYQLDLNRLRLQVNSELTESISAQVQYDVEAYLGSFLKTADFNAFKNYRPPTKYDLISPLIDSDNLYVRQKLYRFYFTFSSPAGDLKIGRQKIPWGVARVYSATDPFNPIDFVNIERDERTGVDAISLDAPLGSLAGLNLVYAGGRTSQDIGGRLRANLQGTDYSILGARLGEDYMLGLDFAGQIRGGGLRGEASYTRAKMEADYSRLVLSYDYSFSSGIYFLTEYFYNGQGKNNSTRNYGFLGLSYDRISRFKEGAYLILNLDDGSTYLNPFLDYSLNESIIVTFGINIFNGKTGAEYARYHDLYYVQAECCF